MPDARHFQHRGLERSFLFLLVFAIDNLHPRSDLLSVRASYSCHHRDHPLDTKLDRYPALSQFAVSRFPQALVRISASFPDHVLRF